MVEGKAISHSRMTRGWKMENLLFWNGQTPAPQALIPHRQLPLVGRKRGQFFCRFLILQFPSSSPLHYPYKACQS
jgi:hypothetical protein